MVFQRGALEALEAPLHAYTRRIKGLESLPYWERLARGKFLSNEKRQHQYRILYCWKVIRGLVPNFGITVDSTKKSSRGFTLAVPPITGTRKAIKTVLVEQRDPGYSTAFPGT